MQELSHRSGSELMFTIGLKGPAFSASTAVFSPWDAVCFFILFRHLVFFVFVPF